MASSKISFVILLSVALTEVYTWTIDLPEARKYFFEKAERHKNEEALRQFNERAFFDNITPDSPHNRDQLRDHRDQLRDHRDQLRDHRDHVRDNDVYGQQYAGDYEYMSYMEKKVHGIVHNGSVYLEGLRRALENYGEVLKNCSRLNLTQPQTPNGPWLPENSPSLPGFFDNQSGSFGNQTGSPNNQPGSFGNQSDTSSTQNGPFNGTMFFNQSNRTLDFAMCARATQAREHVRRLAALALWATRELQDKAYARSYDDQTHDEEEEEAELLLRLAFFLDRLASYTGYEPEPRDYVTSGTDRPSTTTPRPFSAMGDVPEDVKNMMMNCLQSNSSEPATERCRYPLEYPDFIRQAFNMTDTPQSVQAISTESNEPRDQSLMEFLQNPTQRSRTARRVKRDIAAADEGQERGDQRPAPRDKRAFLINALLGPRLAHNILEGINEEIVEAEHIEDLHLRKKLFEKLAKLKHNTKKIVEFVAAIRHRHELEKALEEHEGDGEFVEELKEKRVIKHGRYVRSADNPLLDVMKYYVKHKVWSNANQENPGELDVANHVDEIKLSPDEFRMPTDESNTARVQKRSIDNKKYEHLKLPEKPFQDISEYVIHRKGVNYITDENETRKLRQFLDKIQHSKSATAKEYAQKLLKRKTRSAYYGRKYMPSPAENPSQDISYYVKNKEGREYRADPVQAAQVRASLERVFQNPNIEIVRRYGFNFNPLIPYPLGYGVAASFYGDL